MRIGTKEAIEHYEEDVRLGVDGTTVPSAP
jgi:hypothetical protein